MLLEVSHIIGSVDDNGIGSVAYHLALVLAVLLEVGIVISSVVASVAYHWQWSLEVSRIIGSGLWKCRILLAVSLAVSLAVALEVGSVIGSVVGSVIWL